MGRRSISRSRSRGRPPRRARSRSRSPSRSRGRGPARTPPRAGDRSRSRRSVTPPRDRSRRRSRSDDRRGRGSRRRRSRSRSSTSSASSSSSSSSRSRSRSRSRTPPRRKSRAMSDEKTEKDVKERPTPTKATPSAVKTESPVDTRERRRHSVSPDRTPPRVKRGAVGDADKTPPRAATSGKPQQRDDATPPRRSGSPQRTPPRSAKKEDSVSAKTPPRSSKATPSPVKGRKRSVSPSATPPRDRKRRNDRRSASSERSPTPKRSKHGDSRRRGRRRSRSSSEESTPPRRSKRDRTPERRKTTRSASPEKKASPVPVRRTTVTVATANGKSSRTGGVYVPPFKLAQMRREIKDKSSEEYQRTTWDALRKSINGLINKVNVSNISNIIPELFQENLVRGRGVLARSIMKAQLASPGFTHIYAALVAVLNTRMPENGELLIKRVIYRFRRSLKRGDKVVAIALVRFIAHLVNQQVVHELLALQVLELLLANPTDDSVEVAVNFTKECGQILTELCPDGLRAIFESFRGILHEGDIDKRVQYTIEGLFAIRKGGFADYPSVHEQLDLVESSDQITHEVGLDDEIDCEDQLDVFRFDPEYEKNEHMWSAIKKEILGESDSDSDADDESGSGSSDDESDDEDAQKAGEVQQDQNQQIQDFTEQDLVNLRRTIYLTIMSSISHEECAHKLMKLSIRPGQEKEICAMLIECCSQERTYQRYYGLLGQRFCMIKREYQDAFDLCFSEQYGLIHRLETNKLRNVAKFFAHLLYTDALPWTVFEYIRVSEEDTTSSSRIFIKILCQELSEHLGLKKLKERFLDPIMQTTFGGLFPKDNPRNTRFAINFFTSIGLGGLTTDLREWLKNAPKLIMAQTKADSNSSDSDSDSDSSGSSSGSDSGSSSSSGSSSGSESSDTSSSDDSDSD